MKINDKFLKNFAFHRTRSKKNLVKQITTNHKKLKD